MADDFTELNPGSGGGYMDESAISYPSLPTTRKRPRVVVTGEGLDTIADVVNQAPSGTEYGLVVKTVVPNYAGTSVVHQNEISLVPINTETTIVTFTVPTGKIFSFLSMIGSGNTDGVYRLYINNQRFITARSSIASPTTLISYSNSPFSAVQSSIVELRIIHDTNSLCKFEGTLIGYMQ